MAKGPSDSILGRFAFDVQEAFEAEREHEAVRREAAGEATERAARWAGLVRDPAFVRTNAWRAAHLTREAERLAAIHEDVTTTLAMANRLTERPDDAGSVRVFGRVTSPEAGGEADLVDDEGCVIASAPIDPLGGYAIVTEATGEEARLEIRDAKGQRAVLDGRPLTLTPGLSLQRDFATGRCGNVDPVEPEPDAGQPEMPDLIGTAIENARADLAALGAFRVIEDRRFDPAVPADTIIDQTPATGQPLQNGSLVLLAVSDGAEDPQEMPELAGRTEAEALKTLADLAYRSVRFTHVRDLKRAGRIIEQAPAPGEPLTLATDITLCLAVAALLMPRVTGHTRMGALEILVPAYVEAAEIEEAADPGPPDRVLRQRPRTGEAIGGDGLQLTVSVAGKDAPEEVLTMPRVVGLTRAQALVALAAVPADEIAFDERPERGHAGLVAAQRPAPGSKNPRKIRLTLSSPLEDDGKRMPDVRGKSLDVAKVALVPGITEKLDIEERPHSGPPGAVLDQRPDPGEPVEDGATLIVSVGGRKGDATKEDRKDDDATDEATPTPKGEGATVRRGGRKRRAVIDMPDLTGLTLTRARKLLSEAGLGAPSYDTGAARKKGNRVTAQSPAPGTAVSSEDDVDLTFGTPD